MLSRIIDPEELESLDQGLLAFLKDAHVRCALLVGRNGMLVTKQGFTEGLDTTAISALAASAYMSTQELARLVGENEFDVLYHQGKNEHLHVSAVDTNTLLVAAFDDRTSEGMVRLCAEQYAKKLAQVLTEAEARHKDVLRSLAGLKEAEKTELFEQPGSEGQA